MLKKDIIKANAALASLTDEQITAIENLSQNDENTVIASKVSEIYNRFDADILEASGIAKVTTEKSYDYAKRVANELKGKAAASETLNTQINELKAEKTRLETAIAAGSTNKEAVAKLNSVTAELEQTKTQFNELKTKFDNTETEYNNKLLGFRIENEISAASGGVKFKKEFSEQVTKTLLTNAVAQLKGNYKHEFIDDGAGGQRLVFLDKSTGGRLNNPENQLHPFTASELLQRDLKVMGVLDEGRQQTGGGSTAGGTGSTGGTLDLSGARSKVEANNIAAQALMAQGLTRGSQEYQTALDKAWTDYNVKDLPEAV